MILINDPGINICHVNDACTFTKPTKLSQENKMCLTESRWLKTLNDDLLSFMSNNETAKNHGNTHNLKLTMLTFKKCSLATRPPGFLPRNYGRPRAPLWERRGGGSAKQHYSVKDTEGSCCPKLTIDSFIGDVVHVEALGAVGSPNFVAVLRLLLRSSRQNQHDQRVNDTENQQRLHFVSAGGEMEQKG